MQPPHKPDAQAKDMADAPSLALQASVRPFRIGIIWQGNPKYKGDRLRSVPLAHYAPLASVEGVQLLSLQKGPGTEQLAAFAERYPVTDLASRLDQSSGPFMDTAAVPMNLDLSKFEGLMARFQRQLRARSCVLVLDRT